METHNIFLMLGWFFLIIQITLSCIDIFYDVDLILRQTIFVTMTLTFFSSMWIVRLNAQV